MPDSQRRTRPDEAPSRDVVRRFVEHWGAMARLWGINSTMGEIFALLFLSGREWTAHELREHLRVSRGNVSMNLRELLSWGVIHKAHRHGDRRDYFRAETDVWTLFRRIITERKRRELEPTLHLLRQTVVQLGPFTDETSLRAQALFRFFATIDQLADRLIALQPHELQNLLTLLDSHDQQPANPSPAPRLA
ncbi:MAG: transcriptional regulator [Isosphaeraceae bacterium]|jgi:DNA-binding transcriptional regulator GbsR (MarR family)|nr:MAG: transcriptional regulator [Isosphaeraceae bacterium]